MIRTLGDKAGKGGSTKEKEKLSYSKVEEGTDLSRCKKPIRQSGVRMFKTWFSSRTQRQNLQS
jgi:hypothetical protein